MSKCIPKQMRLQPLPEIVGTERRVSEVVRQRVPGRRTGDGERRHRHCHVASARRSATEGGEGRGILCRHAHSLFMHNVNKEIFVASHVLQSCESSSFSAVRCRLGVTHVTDRQTSDGQRRSLVHCAPPVGGIINLNKVKKIKK